MAAPLADQARKLVPYRDMITGALVVAIVLLIVVPVSPGLMDILLTFSLSISLMILLTTLFVTRPLDFSVFPTLLLVVTLFRLALNISSTRLILSQAAAGQVIQTFGEFVVRGNYVVGIIIFAIITIIQFVVITNGAGRVAEVTARFTLDAMPGKQMSIDADLNAGLIDETEARQRRAGLSQEADFYGAMDGASKFVRGDAIAGLIITAVNIVGGLVIGAWQMGMPLMEALTTYTILTVGDGLVSQIPALLVSTATGILITRSGAQSNFGQQLSQQIFSYPRVVALVAAILVALGLIPGMPKLPFFILALAVAYTAYLLTTEEKSKKKQEEEQVVARRRQPEDVLSVFQFDPVEVELGYGLVSLADEAGGGDLLDRLAAIRRQAATDLGLYVRPIRIRDNLRLGANEYVFKVRGVEAARGEIYPGQFLAMHPAGEQVAIGGRETREPTFGLPAWWIPAAKKEEAEAAGCTVVDAGTVLITHLSEFFKQHAHELLGRQEVKELLEVIKQSNPAVVEDLIPEVLSLGEVQRVLQNLLREQVPIRDLVTILETLSDTARQTRDLDALTESVRQALARTISRLYAEDGQLLVITLHPRLEQVLADVSQPTSQGLMPILAPEVSEKLVSRLGNLVQELMQRGRPPVILCSGRVRAALRRLLDRLLPNVAIISYQELIPELEVKSVGTVVLD
ncbi:MAG: flagellar biosynthesis protein FlhA [Clostridia bacterium]|nr:MAG: flagellar biosynthesis protein FlhA [Clostridia bacterium]